MEVEYQLTAEDLIAFQRYHRKNAPKHRLNPVVASVIWISVFVGVLVLFYAKDWIDDPSVDYLASLVPGVAFGAVMTLVGLVLYTKLMAPNATRKLLQQGRNAEKVLGWRRFSIDAQGIHNTSEFFSTIYLWKGVDKVATTDEHIFFYITTTIAYAVPLRAFADARTFDSFVDMAKRYRGMAGVGEAVREVIGEGSPWARRGPSGIRSSAKPGDAADEGIVRGGSDPA